MNFCPQKDMSKIYAQKHHQRCSVGKGVLRNFAKFTGKHPCQVSFLIKLQACNFIKKEGLATGVFL